MNISNKVFYLICKQFAFNNWKEDYKNPRIKLFICIALDKYFQQLTTVFLTGNFIPLQKWNKNMVIIKTMLNHVIHT